MELVSSVRDDMAITLHQKQLRWEEVDPVLEHTSSPQSL
jgi:hypothetical protein